jgi:hypothetical protein
MTAAIKGGAGIGMGIDHAAYRYRVDVVSDAVRRSLTADLQ